MGAGLVQSPHCVHVPVTRLLTHVPGMQTTTIFDGMKAHTPSHIYLGPPIHRALGAYLCLLAILCAIIYTASGSWGTNRPDLWRHAWRTELMRPEPYIMQVHVNLGQDSRASGAAAWAQGPSATQTGRATHVCAD